MRRDGGILKIRGPQAVGDLMAMAYLLPLFGGWLAGRLSLRSVCLAGACALVGAYVAAAMGWPARQLSCLLGFVANRFFRLHVADCRGVGFRFSVDIAGVVAVVHTFNTLSVRCRHRGCGALRRIAHFG